MALPNDDLLGRLAVEAGFVSPDQLAEATRDCASRGVRLGYVLMERSWLTREQLSQLLKQQLSRRVEKGAEHAAASVPPEVPAARARTAPAPRPAADASGPAPAPRSAAAARPEPEAPRSATPATSAAPAAKPTTSAPPPATAGGDSLEAWLAATAERGASDLHVHSGAPLRLRVHGELVDLSASPVDAGTAEAALLAALTPEQRKLFDEYGEVDFACALEGVGRFRANVYRQHRGVDGTFRRIPPAPPSLETLGLPPALAKLTNHHRGLVLVTGPAGCGKSSTLAALIDIINQERREHILTVEDPIEVVHPSKRCLVNQRQVSSHTESFARALRAALREDPDVIAIGELRDLETIGLALTAAETGHFVLGTLHTGSSIRTINRLIGAFPPNQQDQVRAMLSESLRAVVSQRLVKRADGQGRVPALEVLHVNKAVGNLIRDSKTFQIHSILQTGATQGMCLMDESLAALVREGTITREEALQHCEEPKRFGGAPA